MTLIFDQKNDDFDDEALKQALRRQSAPEGFAERVLLRLDERNLAKTSPSQSNTSSHASWRAFFTLPLVRWAAVAAVAAAMVVGVAEELHYRNLQREHAQGEAAKQRLMLALHIAGSKLQLARSRVNRAGATASGSPAHAEQADN
jgi:hypothetical protein